MNQMQILLHFMGIFDWEFLRRGEEGIQVQLFADGSWGKWIFCQVVSPFDRYKEKIDRFNWKILAYHVFKPGYFNILKLAQAFAK